MVKSMVELERTADEVLGVEGQDDAGFILNTLQVARETIVMLAEAYGQDWTVANDEAQVDHIDDAIEMISGKRPR